MNDAPGAIDRRDRDRRVVEEAREAHLRGPLSFVDFAAGERLRTSVRDAPMPPVLAEGDAVIEPHRQELAVAAAQIEIEGLGAHAAGLARERRHHRHHVARHDVGEVQPAGSDLSRGRSRATRRAWRSDRRWTPSGSTDRKPAGRVVEIVDGVLEFLEDVLLPLPLMGHLARSSRAPPDARSVAARARTRTRYQPNSCAPFKAGDRRISSEPVRCSRAACARR